MRRRPTRRFHVPSAIRPSRFRLDPVEAADLVADGALLVDVRREDDPSPALDGAVRISPDLIPARLATFRRESPIVLACT